MPQLTVSESQSYTNITATTTIYTGRAGMIGIFVASGTGSIKVSDGAATIVNTFTPPNVGFYPIPANFYTSLVITIVGTVDCTVFWQN